MKISLHYRNYYELMNSPQAKAVRDLRDLNYSKHFVFCPKGVRFGAWLDSLNMRDLNAFYFTLAHSWVQFALQEDQWTGKAECIRQAKRYLGFAASTRKGIRPTREGVTGPITRI